jgi:4-carboxymuconolactone decarboxylase
VVDGWEAMLTAIRQKTSVTPQIRELAILRVAVLNRAPYEFEAHVPHAKRAGVSGMLIEQLQQGLSPEAIVDIERARATCCGSSM